MGSFREYNRSFYSCSCFLNGKRHFPSAGSMTKLQTSFLFVSPTRTNQIMKLRHMQSPRPLLLCRSAITISQFDTWHKTCSQWCLSILLIQLEHKGILETCWNKQRKPKGKCSRRGLGMVLLLPPALALQAAAVLLHLADVCFCPAGQERFQEVMKS